MITRSDMLTLVSDVLTEPTAGRAMSELRRVVGATEGSASDAEPDPADVLPVSELDLSMCAMGTPSYRALPVSARGAAAGAAAAARWGGGGGGRV